MGDAFHHDLLPAYLYVQHPTPFLPANRPTARERATVTGHHLPASLSAPRQPHSLSHAAPLPPTFLLLHPLLPLSRVHEFPPNISLTAPHPTVILSSTPARDSARPAANKPVTNIAQTRQHLDGSTVGVHSVQSSAPSMTSNGIPNMASKRQDMAAFPRVQRPSMVSQHSNSVPSTPLQLARQFESRSRSPSPNGGLGSHSPRSVSSEANGPMPTLRAGRAVRCKYETNSAFGRRRMPYTSADILDKAKEEPKKTLDPHEDEKLSGDMRELYDRIQPSQEDAATREKFVNKLQDVLETEFPDNEFKVHVFGSSGNMLYTSDSDVDVCIQTPMKRLEEMHILAEALAKHGMEKVVCVPQAKVRIVKIWDPVLKLACDMNVNTTSALENTRMIKTYVQIDDRVRPLAMIVKYWTKQRILNDAALGGTISSYTWICMILNFLQTRDPPILPSLHKLAHQNSNSGTDVSCNVEFADDLDKLRGFGAANTESLGALLFQFFRKYGYEVDYEKHVISVRQGRLITREEKNWHLAGLQKEARNRLCVEEPFSTERNLGNSADEFAWRGIHLELRRAFDLLADGGQLTKACEQFEFPPEEKTVFKKPVSSKPVLAPSVPTLRNGRGGSNHRGGRGGFSQKGNNFGRRASSGASFGQNRPPFLNSPPISAAPGQEYFGGRGLNEQLHDQLFQQYQLLEMQSNSLRAQLVAQQRVQTAHAHQAHAVQAAQIHAHAIAQAHAQAQGRAASSANGSPQKSPYVNGRNSPRMTELGMPPNALPHGFLYHYPGFFDPAQVANASMGQDGSRTNPSSPSLTHSVPGLRRGIHRASNASDTNSIRSQSQPPRGAQQPPLVPGYPPVAPYFDPSSFAGYPIARSTREVPKSTDDSPYSPQPNHPEPVVPSDNGVPKEYVGYYVAEQPQARNLQDYAVPQIPSYTEIAQRRRRVSSEITQPLLNTALRRVSRSPSPLGGHVRSYSTSVTPQSIQHAPQRKDRIDSTHRTDDNGPVIVNGSFPTQPREARSRSETVDPLVSRDVVGSTALGIFVNQGDIYGMSGLDQRLQLPPFEEFPGQKNTETMRPSIVNGSGQKLASIETNGLSRASGESNQPFASVPESWIPFDSSSKPRPDDPVELSPTQTPSQWRANQFTNALGSLETTNLPRAPPQEIKSAGLPLLSPVFETRTPSPISSRQLDGGKLSNGVKSQSKENNNQHRRASHTPGQTTVSKENQRNHPQKGFAQANDKGNKSNAGNSNQGTWQQSQSKKRNKKPRPQKQATEKTAGEPLPANAADRKGG
ncbi:hypothetical protein BDV95DRAFT_508781 [Massariosphaeria phaeospora]|uniref:polynucleotide adenylyltransferase n=1 Tax=Massariosphaeria phaeospora TaxID=100035 RepID=A0A7C8M1I8_9PLEO|nr:hypothetical protein BDV95DRAFT_508781 [Massariosphaeria phaeospora]